MRITKVILEEDIKRLISDKLRLIGDLAARDKEIKILLGLLKGADSLRIALERSTDALAHIISDLTKRR